LARQDPWAFELCGWIAIPNEGFDLLGNTKGLYSYFIFIGSEPRAIGVAADRIVTQTDFLTTLGSFSAQSHELCIRFAADFALCPCHLVRRVQEDQPA
jgi:hypothetical protein